MIHFDVIIVGGGPAGSSCARELKRHGRSVLILDKQDFPRSKVCAGWITPGVITALGMNPRSYPHTIKVFDRLNFYFWGVKVPVKTRQYAILRREFDHWLLKKSMAPVAVHQVKKIQLSQGRYLIDDTFSSTCLVGAGGTNCPVARIFFNSRGNGGKGERIIAMEDEFFYPGGNPESRLWFFDHGLPGYAWYFPKGRGLINVGIGAKLSRLRKRGQGLMEHWNRLTEKLGRLSLIRGHSFKPRGYTYRLRGRKSRVQNGNAYLIGDAAGLATRDMGEGIKPAIESGVLAARAIVRQENYSIGSISKFSFPDICGRRLQLHVRRLAYPTK